MPADVSFFLNALFFLNFLGTLTTIFLCVPLNAFLPIFLTEVPLKITFLNFLQPKNAFCPILLIFLPIWTDLSFLLFLKASFSIEVTLYVLPLIFIMSGIIIFTGFFFVLFIYLAVLFVPVPVILYTAFEVLSLILVPFSISLFLSSCAGGLSSKKFTVYDTGLSRPVISTLNTSPALYAISSGLNIIQPAWPYQLLFT